MEDLPQDAIERLQRVTRLLSTQRTLPSKLEAIVAMTERTVSNCDAAGIILLIDGVPTTAAVTDRLAVEIDLVQYRTEEGPCLSAMSSGNVIRVQVLSRDSRFARFAPGAIDHRIESCLSIPLVSLGVVVGALNLYSKQPNAFDTDSEEAVRPMAEYAGEAIATSPLYASALDMVDGLVESMESRSLINQAVGVIMAGEQRTTQEALDRLRELALTSGEPLRTVSEWVLAERPTGPSPVDESQLPQPDDA